MLWSITRFGSDARAVAVLAARAALAHSMARALRWCTVLATLSAGASARHQKGSKDVAVPTSGCHQNSTSSARLSGTSGQLFKGEPVRALPSDVPRRFAARQRPSKAPAPSLWDERDRVQCKRWAVVTTIFEPSNAINITVRLPGWCLVIIGDTKTPESSYSTEWLRSLTGTTRNLGAVIFLGVEAQKRIAKLSTFVDELPWAHFSRKNIGCARASRSRGARRRRPLTHWLRAPLHRTRQLPLRHRARREIRVGL